MLSQKEKEEKWKKLCFSWAEESETVYNSVDAKLGTLMSYEIIGGKCPKCGIGFKRIEFNNNFGYGVYYQPACDCYYKCPRCRRSLHLEDAGGQLAENDYFCTNCGFPLNGLAEDEFLKRVENKYTKKLIKKYLDDFKSSSEEISEFFKNRILSLTGQLYNEPIKAL